MPRIPTTKIRLAAPTAVLALALAGCGAQAPAAGPKPAPDFTLKTPAGGAVSLAEMKGKVVLLDFWATWCLPCHEAIPVLERLHRRFGRDGFVVVGVNVDEETGPVGSFMRRFRMSYPVGLDTDMAVLSAYRVRGIPNMFLLDRKGRIRKHWIGLDDALEGVLEAEIRSLLQEKA